jgi:uncharacterized membrane protein YhaH (DUF805 family)
VKWYFHTLRKYAVFSGRARRREYWLFELWSLIVTAVLIFIDFRANESGHPERAVLTGVYVLATALPSLAGLVRRLHDTNRSGWVFFLGVIPLVIPDPQMGYLAPPIPPDKSR